MGMIPQRIQRKREAGWTKPEGAVYVGRPSVFGNPFAPMIIPGWATSSRQYAVNDFMEWLDAPDRRYRNTSGGFPTAVESIAARDKLMAAVPSLRGCTLMCWCHVGQPCHGDVLIRLANADLS